MTNDTNYNDISGIVPHASSDETPAISRYVRHTMRLCAKESKRPRRSRVARSERPRAIGRVAVREGRGSIVEPMATFTTSHRRAGGTVRIWKRGAK